MDEDISWPAVPPLPSPQLRRNRSPLSIRVVRRGGIHACGSACALVHKAQGRAAYIYDPGPVVHNSVGPRTDEVVVAGLVLPRRNLSVRDNATHKYLTSSLSLFLSVSLHAARGIVRDQRARTRVQLYRPIIPTALRVYGSVFGSKCRGRKTGARSLPSR